MIESEKIRTLIAQGESANLEFKTSHDSLSRSVYESICAFLNRKGGYVLLGVKDNGKIVVTENWNIPYQMGRITPNNLIPHPKNPTIAAVFRHLEWVEDLGSGVRNMFRYLPLYVKDKNAVPVMEEGDVFRLTIKYERDGVDRQEKSVKHIDKILVLIQENPKVTAQIMATELSLSENHVRKILIHLISENVIMRTGSRKYGEWYLVK